MVHTSPLDQAGVGDAGGMNIYVCEAAQNMAQQGVQVDIFTRRTNTEVADIVEVTPGVRVIQLNVGPVEGVTKEQLPAYIPQMAQRLLKLPRCQMDAPLSLRSLMALYDHLEPWCMQV